MILFCSPVLHCQAFKWNEETSSSMIVFQCNKHHWFALNYSSIAMGIKHVYRVVNSRVAYHRSRERWYHIYQAIPLCSRIITVKLGSWTTLCYGWVQVDLVVYKYQLTESDNCNWKCCKNYAICFTYTSVLPVHHIRVGLTQKYQFF